MSNRKRSSRRSRTSAAVIDPVRDAASSIANGIPSSLRQISTTAAASAGAVNVAYGDTACARSMNNAAAAELLPARISNDGTGQSCSSLSRSPSRLVARIPTVSEWAKIRSTRSAVASRTCSQLSSTSSRDRPSNATATLSETLNPACWVMPSTAATSSGTAAGSPTAASSMTNTPSGYLSADREANSSASRVLPTPPTPVNVTTRCAFRVVSNSSSSAARPMRLVLGVRRLPGWASIAFNGGNSVRRPSARTWNSSTGLVMSRSVRVPTEMRFTSLNMPDVTPSSRICPPWPAAMMRAARLSTGPK